MEKTPPPMKSIYNSQSSIRNQDCSPSGRPAMANRLLDWFSVVMADAKHRRQHPKAKGNTIYMTRIQTIFTPTSLAAVTHQLSG